MENLKKVMENNKISLEEAMKQFSETVVLSNNGPLTIYNRKDFPAKDFLLNAGDEIANKIGEYINNIHTIPLLESELIKVKQCWMFLLNEFTNKYKIAKPKLEMAFEDWISFMLRKTVQK